jgi:hypothetical protein
MAKDKKLCVKCLEEKPVKGAVFCPNDHMVCYDHKSIYTNYCPVCKKPIK